MFSLQLAPILWTASNQFNNLRNAAGKHGLGKMPKAIVYGYRTSTLNLQHLFVLKIIASLSRSRRTGNWLGTFSGAYIASGLQFSLHRVLDEFSYLTMQQPLITCTATATHLFNKTKTKIKESFLCLLRLIRWVKDSHVFLWFSLLLAPIMHIYEIVFHIFFGITH